MAEVGFCEKLPETPNMLSKAKGSHLQEEISLSTSDQQWQ